MTLSKGKRPKTETETFEDRRDKILQWRSEGVTYKEIAARIGVSMGRVWQILRKYARRKGEPTVVLGDISKITAAKHWLLWVKETLEPYGFSDFRLVREVHKRSRLSLWFVRAAKENGEDVLLFENMAPDVLWVWTAAERLEYSGFEMMRKEFKEWLSWNQTLVEKKEPETEVEEVK